MKTGIYFMLKTLLVLEIFHFKIFFPFISIVSRFKGSDETGIIMTLWIGYVSKCKFWNKTETTLYLILKIAQMGDHLKKEFFHVCFVTQRKIGN